MAKKQKDDVNEPTREIMDLREQGAIDTRSSVGEEGPVPITGEVGVIVLGKDPVRSEIVADVIHSQLQKIGLPMVVRHQFHEPGRSHQIQYDEPSIMDIIGRRDPKLFGTAVVVAHDNLGHKLVASHQVAIANDMVTRRDLVTSNEGKISRISGLNEHQDANRIFSPRGNKAITEEADRAHNIISELVSSAIIDGIYRMEPSIAPVNRLKAIEEFVRRTGVGEAAYDGYRRVENMIVAAQEVEDAIESRADAGLPPIAATNIANQFLTELDMQNEISHPDPSEEDHEMNKQVEEELGDLLTGYLEIHQEETRNPAALYLPRMIDGRAVKVTPIDSADELNRLLVQSGVEEPVRENVLKAFMGAHNLPISGARTIAPGRGFNTALEKLENFVDNMQQKYGSTGNGIVEVDTRPGGKDDPAVVLERVQQRMNENNALTAEVIEDLLTDASELPRDVTVQANGVRLTNDSERGATVKFLKNGITVGRF